MYFEKKLMDIFRKKMSSTDKPITSRQVHRIIDNKMIELGITNKRISGLAIARFYYGINIRKYSSEKELQEVEKKLKEIREFELKISQYKSQKANITQPAKTIITSKVSTRKKQIKKFIEIKTYPSDFYYKLQKDINLAYTQEIYTAVLILIRKLLENLILDILRKRYGYSSKENVNLYFNTDRRQFRPLNTLIKNLDTKIKEGDFSVFPTMNKDLIKEISKYKDIGNRSAHTIEVDLGKDDVKKYEGKLEFVLNVLIQTLNGL